MRVPPPSLSSRPRFGFQDFPDRLGAWITFLGWTLVALAEASNVARGLIAKWLGDQASPSMKSLKKVADVLGVSARDLFDETPWERVRRCLMTAAAAEAGRRPARLADVDGLQHGDFVACMNRVPPEAVPLLEPGTEIVGWLDADGPGYLLGLPLFGPERYPAVHPRRRAKTVTASLEQLDDELRRWRYHSDDRALVARAMGAVADLGDDGEDVG